MRLISILLASFFTIGCGAGSGNHGQDPHISFVLSPPSIVTLLPNSVPVNSVGFTMTVDGANFGTDAVIFWNGMPQRTAFVSANQLLVTITEADLALTGLAHVFVRTGGANSNTVDFNVAPQ